MREVSLVGRLAGAVAAVALFSASLSGPVSAAPLAGVGVNSLYWGIQHVQWQTQPGQGKPGKPGPGGKPGPAGKPGGKPGPGHAGPGPGGGGHWQNGVWVPLAIGFGILGAAAAASAYGAPPQPGMCWYYNDPLHLSGHWDYC